VERGLSLELILWPIAGLTGLTVWVNAGPIAGLILGLSAGLGAAAQYGVFRVLLWRYRIAPLRYVRWLNSTVHLRLLYRGASGGYVFIHRLVQDYFCDAVVDRSSQDSPQTQS